MTKSPEYLEEAAVVDAVHSVKVPATQELTRVVVTVWVSVMEDVRERVIESMRTLPIRSWSSSRLDSTRSTISFTNSFSYQKRSRHKQTDLDTNELWLFWQPVKAWPGRGVRVRRVRPRSCWKKRVEGRGMDKLGTESPLEGVE